MKFKKLLIVMISGSLMMVSCKKDKQTIDPSIEPSPAGNADAIALKSSFKAREASATQSFVVDAAAPQLITGAQGTTIQFNANSFETFGGQAVTGNVDIKLVEVYNKADMILMNKPTVANNWSGTKTPLISGGEFKVMAYQQGTQIKLKNWNSFSANVPAMGGTVDPNMGVFYGDTSANGDTLTWNSADSARLTGQGGIYSGVFDSLGWINCDYFYNDPRPSTFVDVQIPAGFTNQTCALFVSFDGLNSITSFYNYSNQVYSSAPSYQLPVGLNVHFVALAYINGAPQVAIVPATITNNHLEVLPALTGTTLTQLATDINALP